MVGQSRTESWRLEDLAAGLSSTKRSANTILATMNSVMPFLKFTHEVGEDFRDGKLPSLDTAIWVELNRIMFEFFSKPMANSLVVQAKSALSEETKLSSLAEEVNRRMRNTSRKVEHSRRLEILEDLCTKMTTSGHTPKFIRRALIKGLGNYLKKVRRSELPVDNPGFQPLYILKNSSGSSQVMEGRVTNQMYILKEQREREPSKS